ncbi:MAG: hypothetical protein CMF61_03360 [Magnetococcales bacterium]|nr:hypothetical protein [Magnetococcales bacterium]
MNKANMLLTMIGALSLTACGGGGDTAPATPQTQAAPPPAPVTTGNSSDVATPSKAEVFAVISDHFAHTTNINFARFDVLDNDRMLVAFSDDTDAPETVMVDFSDPNNITFTDLGKSSHHRGLIEVDLDHDSIAEIYTFSHGYEYVYDGDDNIQMAKQGDNFLIDEFGELTLIGGNNTHGACAGDFNGDSNVDIVDVNVYHGNTPVVRYNDGNADLSNAQDMPAEMLARHSKTDEGFTTCTSADVNQDGFDDVILGRNVVDIEPGRSVDGQHVILYGSADGLEFDEQFSVIDYNESSLEGLTNTTGMFTVDNYMVAFVTDYETTQIELFEVDSNNNSTYTFVQSISIDQATLDIEVKQGQAVITDTWTRAIDDYYTEPAYHVTVENGSLQVEHRLRD